jgi:isopentenyl-diphosphate Delta-isomerase
MNKVILVDENDQEIGSEEKLKAHVDGKLHRAFSVFIFNSKNELLLQQRALEKYHSGGLWTNTVCSHPAPGEDINASSQKRLMEEMGFTTKTKEIYSFLYKSEFENGLTEHEFDHVFIGSYDSDPIPNPEEVMDFKWISIDDLRIDMERNPSNYTTWFRLIMKNKEFLDSAILEK